MFKTHFYPETSLKPSFGLCDAPEKVLARSFQRSFSRFDVYWIKTNKQTEHMCPYTGVCVWVSAYLSVCMAEEDL